MKLNDIITAISDSLIIVLKKLVSALFEIPYYITGVFEDCKYFCDKYYFIIIISVITSIAIIIKFLKNYSLKKRFLSGFLISTGIFIFSAITGIILRSGFNFPENIYVFIFMVNIFLQAVSAVNSLILFSAYVFVRIGVKHEEFQDKF